MAVTGTANEIEPVLVPVTLTVYIPGGVEVVLDTVRTRVSELPAVSVTELVA